MIHILLVDDQNFTRKALGAVLKNEPNLTIVGEAENGNIALEIMSRETIDIAVVDLDMPKMDGFELTQKVRQHFPQTKIIILSSHDDRDSINKAVKFGARGYLLKDTSVNEVIDTINYVQRGYFQLGPGLFEKIISESINYELETSGYLSQLETKSESDLAQLKQEIMVQNERVRQDVLSELDLEINRLKFELKQGLNKFQSQVSLQLKNGFAYFTNIHRNSQFIPELWHQRYLQITKNINLIDNKYQLSVEKLTREIVIWRYCMIFLLVVFLIEKTLVLMK